MSAASNGSPERLPGGVAEGAFSVQALTSTLPWVALNLGLQLGDRLPPAALEPILQRLGLRSTHPEGLAQELEQALLRSPPDPGVITALLAQLRTRLGSEGPETPVALRNLGLGLARVLEAKQRPKQGQVAAGPLARFALRSR